MDRIRKRAPQAGISLIETMVATMLMVVIAVGVMAIAVMALTTSENQGHLIARTSEYSQDKMEQLLALAFNDSSSNTTVVPTTSSGGTGLATGGGITPASPVTGYVDYLDSSGNVLTQSGSTAPTGWFYIRVWSIAAGPSDATNTKLITVVTQTTNQVGSYGSTPKSTVEAIKANPF